MGERDEIRYTFALRGATILAWNGGDKRRVFPLLRDFYDIRSDIIHGRSVDQVKLNEAQTPGGKWLRDVWWWCFNQRASLFEIKAKIDERILE
jgi:hypothetical protein